MACFETILLAVRDDGPATRDALALAARFAEQRSATLVLAGVVLSRMRPRDSLYEVAARSRLVQDTRTLAETLPEQIAHRVELVSSSSVARGLHDLAQDLDASVMVLGPTHHGRLGRMVHGDIAAEAMHDAACTIAVASPGLRSGLPDGDVVVGWDGSPESRAAVDAGARIARDEQATLRVVHVVDVAGHVAYDPWILDECTWREMTADADRQAHQALDTARAQVSEEVSVVTALVHGSPATELVRAAADARMLVVGVRGHGAWRRVLLGSTSTAAMHHATCPVVIATRGTAQDPQPDPEAVIGETVEV